jgi:hypothetical protein
LSCFEDTRYTAVWEGNIFKLELNSITKRRQPSINTVVSAVLDIRRDEETLSI